MKKKGRGYEKPEGKIATHSIIEEDFVPRKKGQGSHEVHKTDTVEYQDKVKEIYQYIKEGLRSNEIYAMLLVEDDRMTESKFIELLKHAHTYAHNELHKDREYMFMLHMARYEEIFSKCMIMEDSWHRPLDKKKDWHIMTAKYAGAIQALNNKEDLLGLHDKSVVIEFNDQKATVLEVEEKRGAEGVIGYDLDKLTLEEQVEMLELIKECRTVPIEGIQRVVVKKTVVEIDVNGERNQLTSVQNIDKVETKDITFEEMPPDVVSKFKHIDENPEPEPEKKPNEVKDSIPEHIKQANKRGSPEAVGNKINKSLLESFKEKMKKDRESRKD